MPDDICQGKHGGNAESVEAFATTSEKHREAMRQRIYVFAMFRLRRGITPDETAAAFGLFHNDVAPRCSEMKRDGRLVAIKEKRRTRSNKSARVLVTDKVYAFMRIVKDPAL
jgi:hypothetical protein